MIDIAIVGSGVTGCAAALTLAQSDLDVVLVTQPNVERERPGESLASAATAILRDLGVEQRFGAIPHRAANLTYSAWGADLLARRDGIALIDGPGFVIDRSAFEDMLREAVVANGVAVSSANIPAARFTIDCTGRAAVVARAWAERQAGDQLIAAYAYLPQCDPTVEPTPATLIEAVAEGWWYASLLPDGRLAIALFADPDTLPKGMARDGVVWEHALERTRYVREWVASAGFYPLAPIRLASAATSWLDVCHGADWVAAGDAALTLDPLSSHGLVSALWGGREAALAAQAGLRGDGEPMERYARTLSEARRAYLEQRTLVYRAEGRFAEHPFWQRRQ